jgi:hypothetical protein
MNDRDDIDETSDSDDEAEDLRTHTDRVQERAAEEAHLGKSEDRPPQPGVTPPADPEAD